MFFWIDEAPMHIVSLESLAHQLVKIVDAHVVHTGGKLVFVFAVAVRDSDTPFSFSRRARQTTRRANGVGFPAPPQDDETYAGSLGMRIVQALTRQMDGTLRVGPGPGCEITVEFPEEA